jgi:2-amino-4-hydroxy-6-hydroxymethyldihydropteridine diphosphokinase
MKKRVYIGMGSNMGSKAENLARARQMIEAIDDVNIVKASSLYQTPPWGKTDQEDFINQVIAIDTELPPLELLHELQNLEIKLGRQRHEHWGPRVIDLDILLFGEENIATEELKVPHPYVMQRLFVLMPLQEIEPDMAFPDGSKIAEVLNRLTGSAEASDIRKL